MALALRRERLNESSVHFVFPENLKTVRLSFEFMFRACQPGGLRRFNEWWKMFVCRMFGLDDRCMDRICVCLCVCVCACVCLCSAVIMAGMLSGVAFGMV